MKKDPFFLPLIAIVFAGTCIACASSVPATTTKPASAASAWAAVPASSPAAVADQLAARRASQPSPAS